MATPHAGTEALPDMTNIVLLNNVDHGDLTVVTGAGAAFGDAINQALIFPTEFEDAQRDYPIFFRQGEDGAFHAVALLGLDRDENLFLAGDRWQARYIPAVQRRGPFSIGLQGDAEPMINIDLDHPRVVASGGEPVFLPHGGNTPYLESIAGVLQRIHTGLAATAPMFAAFQEAGLIRPVTVELSLSETERYDIPDLFTIDTEALAALDGETLARLHSAGFLALAIHAASSLGNVPRLIELKLQRATP